MSDGPRRIIFVNRVYWPSLEATAQLLTDLAEGLAAQGRPVHVICAGESSTQHRGVLLHRTGAGEHHGGLLSRALNFRRFERAVRRKLASVAQPGDLVVSMTDPPLLATAVARLAAELSLRHLCWVQDIYPEIARVHFGPLTAPLCRLLQPRRDAAWRSAAACVTLDDDMRQTLLNRGVEAARVVVQPNWAPQELDAMPDAAAVAAQRRAWGVEGKFVVAYSGNLGRVHEFGTILEAAARLRERPDLAFVFVGRGPRFDEVAGTVRRQHLANVRLLPPVPRAQLAASLAAADAHLVTLRPEYAGLVHPSKLAGALAAGRPVLLVSPPASSLARLLAHHECGACIPPGDGAALAARIAAWQGDPALTQALGRNARAAYAGHFAFSAALHRWQTLLDRAAAG